jgi:hypothetical protein
MDKNKRKKSCRDENYKKKVTILLCKIWGFHGGDYEEWRPVGCYAVWFL